MAQLANKSLHWIEHHGVGWSAEFCAWCSTSEFGRYTIESVCLKATVSGIIEGRVKENNKLPAKDIYHDNMKNALIKDGWTVTHEQMHLKWGAKDMYVDIGAEKLMAAEKNGRKIGVEVKSFVGHSEINELQKAVGQYVMYHDVLEKTDPDRELYLAVPEEIFGDLFEEPIGRLLLDNERFRLIVFDPFKEVILKWIP